MRAISMDDLRPLRARAEAPGMLAPSLIVASLAAWYLTPWPTVNWVWAVVYAGLAWRWPRWALALLPLTFPFWFAPVHVTVRLSFPLSELALAALALVVSAKVALGSRRLWPRRARLARAYLARLGWPVILGALLLLAGMTVGVLIARAPQPALRAWRWEIAEPLVYAALLVWRLRGRWLWRTLWAFVASGALVAALALAQAAFAHVTFAPLGAGGGLIRYPAWNGLDWRATAIIYGSPNTAGAWMARALPLALAIALWPRAARAWARGLAAFALAALLVGLALTGSRGAWVGAAAGAAVVGLGLAATKLGLWRVAPWAGGPAKADGPANEFAPEGHPATTSGFADATPNPRRRVLWRHALRRALRREFIRRPSLSLAVLALVAALVYGTSSLWLAPLVGLVGSGHGGSGEERLLVWQAARAMGRDHPLLGVGPDQFLYYYSPRYTSHPYLIATINGHPSVAAHLPTLSHPHNLGLELWLSAGLIGLIGYMLALVGAAWRGLSALAVGAAGRLGWRGALLVGVLGGLAAALAHGLVDSAYFEPDYALAFWWGVAALVALGHVRKRPARGG